MAGQVTPRYDSRFRGESPLVNTYEQVSPSNVRAHFAQECGRLAAKALPVAPSPAPRRPYKGLSGVGPSGGVGPPPFLASRKGGLLRAPAPRYVSRCGCDALWTWERAKPVVLQRRPLLCGSWRHEGACARYSASVAFARIKEAVERPEYRPDGWVFAVLTIDRDGYYGGRRWTDTAEAYRELSRMSRNFLSALRKSCKKNGGTPPGSNWVAVVEAHRSGWPHVNLLMYAPELAGELEEDRLNNLANGETQRESILLSGELGRCARQAGWGAQSTAERARSRDALAGYIVKLAGQNDRTSGELAKLTQAPTQAARGFRRIRSGKGFLPKKRKNIAYTGTLLRRIADPQRFAFAAMPLVAIRDPEARRVSELCLPLEEDRIAREHRAAKLHRETGLPLKHFAPPTVETFRLVDNRYILMKAEDPWPKTP